jgi:hypothetical protein
MARALKKVADDVVIGTKARVAMFKSRRDDSEDFRCLEHFCLCGEARLVGMED